MFPRSFPFPATVFKTVALNHSATLPAERSMRDCFVHFKPFCNYDETCRFFAVFATSAHKK
ncbi:hypothetical protein CU102_08380 [Phyllobacterium brassicacearum]|uniref:Uncharacterized protein n=1 Tax=Phyllobacterium brassicacearum TaxID=314235 RepID=A0A2P7BSE6_9HYPH|nr:hypothetical protein CU102_08380 [Phyllobacterium brassicacearum]